MHDDDHVTIQKTLNQEFQIHPVCLALMHNTQFLNKRNQFASTILFQSHVRLLKKTRVLWNTYPVRCCCMKLCETQLIAE